MAVTEHERGVLDIEARHWRYAATKEAAFRAELDMSATRYYQVLNSLTGNADAWEYAPRALARVVRLRDKTRLRRSA